MLSKVQINAEEFLQSYPNGQNSMKQGL